MASQNLFSVAMPPVHSTSFAKRIIGTFGTNSSFCPASLTHDFKPIVPDVDKPIGINVSLNQCSVNIWTGRYSAIGKNRPNVNSSPAKEKTIAHFFFVFACVGFATERCSYSMVVAFFYNKIHQIAVLLLG